MTRKIILALSLSEAQVLVRECPKEIENTILNQIKRQAIDDRVRSMTEWHKYPKEIPTCPSNRTCLIKFKGDDKTYTTGAYNITSKEMDIEKWAYLPTYKE